MDHIPNNPKITKLAVSFDSSWDTISLFRNCQRKFFQRSLNGPTFGLERNIVVKGVDFNRNVGILIDRKSKRIATIFDVYYLFQLMVLRKHWLDFLIERLNLKLSFCSRLPDLNIFCFIPCVGVLIVRGCQKPPIIGKSLHSNSYFSIPTCLIYSTNVEIKMPLPFEKLWV